MRSRGTFLALIPFLGMSAMSANPVSPYLWAVKFREFCDRLERDALPPEWEAKADAALEVPLRAAMGALMERIELLLLALDIPSVWPQVEQQLEELNENPAFSLYSLFAAALVASGVDAEAIPDMDAEVALLLLRRLYASAEKT